jgi:glycosyl transferase family 25
MVIRSPIKQWAKALLPIFYINMASRPDRRDHVERQLASLGLTGTRVEAVTPSASELPAGFPLSAGELGCSRSHQKIWRMMVEQNIGAALILEDDVLLANEVPALLADPALLAGGVEAIQLESRGYTRALVGPGVPTGVPGVSRNRLMSSSLGSAAYIMTLELARRLLVRPDVDRLALDTLLFGWAGELCYDARIFQTLPALAIQLDQTVEGRRGVGLSDLDSNRLTGALRHKSLVVRWRRLKIQFRHYTRVLVTFGSSGELWGARKLQFPIAENLRKLM